MTRREADETDRILLTWIEEVRERAHRQLYGAVTDDGSLAYARDGSSPADTEGQAAPGTAHGGCQRDDIGDECRCGECEERRRAEAERAWEVAEERGL